MIINFKDAGHKDFFMKAKELCREWDTYHQALFYALGICEDCRTHLHDVFCFDRQDYGIKPDTVFNKAWQTSGSLECIRLGYNLFNGYEDDYTSPYMLFSGSYAPYLLEAIKLRYPDAFKGERYQIEDESGHVIEENIYPLFIAESYVSIYEREYGGTYTIKPQEPIILDID